MLPCVMSWMTYVNCGITVTWTCISTSTVSIDPFLLERQFISVNASIMIMLQYITCQPDSSCGRFDVFKRPVS